MGEEDSISLVYKMCCATSQVLQVESPTKKIKNISSLYSDMFLTDYLKHFK